MERSFGESGLGLSEASAAGRGQAHDREQDDEEVIKSVLGWTFPDFELDVVDDGSTDGTAAIVGRLAAEDPRIRVFTQANQGIVGAANVGCAAARGTYLARFDSDDVCLPDRLMIVPRPFAGVLRKAGLLPTCGCR